MADDEEFEEQLEQEKKARVEEEEREAVHQGLTYTDTDGTVMEWDPVKKAYFPQIDSDFIARYQMNYGADTSQTANNTTTTSDTTTTTTTATTDISNNSSSTATDNAQAWQDYYNYYNYYNTDQQATTETTEGENKDVYDESNYSTADNYAYYAYYYGEDYAKKWLNTRMEEEEEAEEAKKLEEAKKEEGEDGQKEEDKKSGEEDKKKDKEKEGVKRKAPDEPPAWFDMDTEKSTHVYVSGLPSDLTDEQFQELMSKYGLIMFDPHTHKPKLKLYRNSDGTLKGDGLCCYIKQESVDLALNILDGSDVHGSTITVERAKFELKGDFDPKKKKKKLSNKAKRKLKERQAKLFDWRPDMPAAGVRMKFERIVVLKNMFDVKEFEADPSLINELRDDVRTECAKFGEVRKVQLHDRHQDGVISITFQSPEEADACIAALNGRWFAKRQVHAETYDGKTKYDIQETEEEKAERLRNWEAFIADSSKDKKTDSQKAGQSSTSSGSVADDGSQSGQPADSGASGATSDNTDSVGREGGGDRRSPPSLSHDSQGGAAN